MLRNERFRAATVGSGRYITAVSSFQPRPCDSATPGYVMYPAYVFTPSRIAGFSSHARSRPFAHNSARYGNVALANPKVDVWDTAAGRLDTPQCGTSSTKSMGSEGV